MAAPVLDRILTAIRDRLKPFAIDRAEGQVSIVRDGRPINSESTSIIVQQLATLPAAAFNRMGNPPAKGFTLPVSIHVFVEKDQQESEDDYVEKCNAASAEVVKLITLSGEIHWFTFGGNSIGATIGATRYLPTDAGIRPGIAVPLSIAYRVSESDHTEARN
jgi:hypothetical protein